MFIAVLETKVCQGCVNYKIVKSLVFVKVSDVTMVETYVYNRDVLKPIHRCKLSISFHKAQSIYVMGNPKCVMPQEIKSVTILNAIQETSYL